jgi:3-oxoacyl-[acyl-carrier protein] reductase
MKEQKGRVQNKIAIVTGASRGIGKAIALLFGREGGKIVVNYNRSEAQANKIVKKIEDFGSEAVAIQADVADKTAVEKMVKDTISTFNNVDILVNNAGVAIGGGALQDFNEEEYDPMWSVNVKGILNCARKVAPFMKEKKYGKIVNLASVAGLGTSLLPGNMLYASTKAAVIILTKRLALELGEYGINVNAIAPGLIKTDMAFGRRTEEERLRRIKYFEEHSMLKRIGEPIEIANAALFLASDESSFMTAQTITLDGGRTDFITHSL